MYVVLRKLLLFHEELKDTANRGDFIEAIDYEKVKDGYFQRKKSFQYINPTESLTQSECKALFGAYLDFMHHMWNHIYNVNNHILQDEMIVDAISAYGSVYDFDATADDPFMMGREMVAEDSLECTDETSVELDAGVLLFREKCLEELQERISMYVRLNSKTSSVVQLSPSALEKASLIAAPRTEEEGLLILKGALLNQYKHQTLQGIRVASISMNNPK